MIIGMEVPRNLEVAHTLKLRHAERIGSRELTTMLVVVSDDKCGVVLCVCVCQDGFLVSGESRTWMQTLCFQETTQVPLKRVENLARLTLFLSCVTPPTNSRSHSLISSSRMILFLMLVFPRFEAESVDLLAAQLRAGEQHRGSIPEESWLAATLAGRSPRFDRYDALCNLLLEVRQREES